MHGVASLCLAEEFKRIRACAPVIFVLAVPVPEPGENSVYADALVKLEDPEVLIERVQALLPPVESK